MKLITDFEDTPGICDEKAITRMKAYFELHPEERWKPPACEFCNTPLQLHRKLRQPVYLHECDCWERVREFELDVRFGHLRLEGLGLLMLGGLANSADLVDQYCAALWLQDDDRQHLLQVVDGAVASSWVHLGEVDDDF